MESNDKRRCITTTAATIVAELLLDASKFVKGIGEASKSSDSFSAKMKDVGKTMMAVGGTLTATVTAPIVAFGVSSVKSAMDAESAMADLQAVLTSTGGVAGMTMEALLDQAAALQKVTKFADEDVEAAQGMLLTFTKIGKDVFPAATEATLDMAEKFGMDASQAAITLGKALNDPVAGATALRRIGVALSDEQEAQIKKFMEVGDVASAQAIIMKELATEIGGVARAAGATTAGKMTQFNNQLDDMKEKVGAVIIPLLLRFMNAITPLIEKFTNAPPALQTFILVVAAIAAAIGPVILIIGSLVTAVGTIAPIVAGLGPVLAGIGAMITGTVLPAIGSLIAALAPVLLPIAAIIAVLALLYLAWKNNFGGIQDKFAAFVAWLKPLWDALWKGLMVVFSYFAAQFKSLGEAFRAAANGDWTTFGAKIREIWDRAWGAVADVVRAWLGGIRQTFMNNVNAILNMFRIDWGEVGRNIIEGIANGITDSIDWIIDAAKKAAKAALDAAKGFLGIKSPSKVFQMQVGWQMAAGTAAGWEQGIDNLLMPVITNGLTPPFVSSPAGIGGAAGNTTDNTIIALLERIANKKDLDEDRLARLIRDGIAQIQVRR